MTDPATTPTQRRWWSYPLPWVVLAAGLLVTLLARTLVAAKTGEIAADRFGRLSEQVAAQIEARARANLQVLRGARGFWQSGAPVTPAAWRQYVAALALEDDYPGILALGYGELAEAARSGAVLQVEPLRGHDARVVGHELLALPAAREALERARVSNAPAVSAPVQLPGRGEQPAQPGFLAFLPIDNGAPQAGPQPRGFVFGAIGAHDLVRHALPSVGLYLQYALYDGAAAAEERLLFRSDEPGREGSRSGRQRAVALVVGGRPWTLVAQPGPLLAFADRNALRLVVLSGVLISLLLFALTLALAGTRQRADQLARRMTADLHAREREVERIAAQLRQSNEDLQQFAYAASHDLKEPLRSIASSLGLLGRRIPPGLDASVRELLDYANDGAQRLSELIDNLLDYARVQSEAGPVTPVDLEEAVDTALRDLGALITDSRAEIVREPLPRVMGDRAQLIRVMQNLLDNAVKYSRQHAAVPQVRLTARREGAEWIVGVTDNGIGIAPEHHDKIFMMFKRLHTRQEYEGNGMGLALCKRIVQRLGGRMWLESQRGAGATFYLALAAADAGLPRPPAGTAAPAQS